MKLRSTFFDCYDLAFNNEGPVFHRIGGHTGPSKREQFRLLEAAGYLTPPHGILDDVAGTRWESECRYVREVVVYEDENAHCTEGKRLLRQGEYKFDGCLSRLNEIYRLGRLYCSAFLRESWGLSWRHLQVGPHVFWIEYRSQNWMSNLDGECQVIGVELNKGLHPYFRRPLFAIDFVIGKELYAVDLNYAPGIRWTGVENIISDHEIVRAIEDGFNHFGGDGYEALGEHPDRVGDVLGSQGRASE